MESASADASTDPSPSENPNAKEGGRSVWVVLAFVALGVLGALAGVAGYLRQSELLGEESELPEEGDAGEPVVVYAAVPSLEPELEVEPLPVAPSEPEWAEPLAAHDVADDVVAKEVLETPVVDDERSDEAVAADVPALAVPALDDAPAQEVHSESGESRIDFEPAALFADPLAMRDRRGSLRR
jgi:hypothetical protein